MADDNAIEDLEQQQELDLLLSLVINKVYNLILKLQAPKNILEFFLCFGFNLNFKSFSVTTRS